MVFGLNGATPTRTSNKSSVSSLGIPSPGSNRDAIDGSNRKKRGGTKESSTTNINGHVEPAEEVALMNGIHGVRNLDSGQMPNEDDEAAVYFTKTVKKNSPISAKVPGNAVFRPANFSQTANESQDMCNGGNITSGADGDDEQEVDWRSKWPVFNCFEAPYRRGCLLLAAIMKLGIVYGFVSTLKHMHDWLFRNPQLIGFIYWIWVYLWQYTSFSITVIVGYAFTILYHLFIAIAPDRIKTQALKYYEEMSSAYIEIDRNLADRLTDYIENHPWTQLTTTELLDDLFHYFLIIFERLAGFPGRKPFMQNETCKQNSKVAKCQQRASWSQRQSETPPANQAAANQAMAAETIQ